MQRQLGKLKFRVNPIAALAVGLALGAVALISRPLAASAAVSAAEGDPRPTVTVVGDGRVLVQPDVAYVDLGVQANGQTFTEAQTNASTQMQAVIDTLIGLGIPREDIRTSRLSAHPVYDQRDNTTIRGYQANNSVQIKVRNLDQVGAVVDAVTAAGANRVDGVSFAVEQQDEPKTQARELAMQHARAKADQLASLAGMRVVSVKSIEETDATSTPRPQPMAARSEAAAAAPPVEPGTQEIRTMVTITYVME